INRERQNPVSGLKSIFLQDVVVPFNEGNANSFTIQPVWPFKVFGNWKFVTYTIVPFMSVPPLQKGSIGTSGLGNILFNGFFRPEGDPNKSFIWGIGPAIQFPTRTDPNLGSNRVSLGPTGLLYWHTNPLSGGIVLQNYWSLGGEGSNKVNQLAAQYVVYCTLPMGWYLQSNATLTANWLAEHSDIWTIPVGGGPGRTFQIGKGKSFYSASVQGFYNAARPEIVGAWMVIAQFQIIFGM
ncbi:MAG TPA: hypothetical protein VFZ47_01805, partial [Chitinophagaceae bacterium]